MKFTPHPSTLAKISADTGRRLQTSEVDDAGRRRSATYTPKDYVAKNVAGYQFPDGRMATANDMYAPSYPEGSEPGLVDVLYKAEFYRDDTSGYTPQILDFRSVGDLEAQGMSIDLTAAALVLDADGQDALVVADSEEALTAEIEATGGIAVKRAPLKIPGDLDGDLRVFFGWSAPGGVEIYAADTKDRLCDMLQRRLGFLTPAGDQLEDMIEALKQHADRPDLNWRIAYSERSEEPLTEPGF